MSEDVERITISWPAPTGEVFAPGCLDLRVGTCVVVTTDAGSTEGKIVAVEIMDHGYWATADVEIPAGTLPHSPVFSGFSVRPAP